MSAPTGEPQLEIYRAHDDSRACEHVAKSRSLLLSKSPFHGVPEGVIEIFTTFTISAKEKETLHESEGPYWKVWKEIKDDGTFSLSLERVVELTLILYAFRIKCVGRTEPRE